MDTPHTTPATPTPREWEPGDAHLTLFVCQKEGDHFYHDQVLEERTLHQHPDGDDDAWRWVEKNKYALAPGVEYMVLRRWWIDNHSKTSAIMLTEIYTFSVGLRVEETHG